MDSPLLVFALDAFKAIEGGKWVLLAAALLLICSRAVLSDSLSSSTCSRRPSRLASMLAEQEASLYVWIDRGDENVKM